MKKIFLIICAFICAAANAQEVLTLEDCISMGDRNNPYVRNSQLDILSSRAMKRELTWQYFPDLSLIGFAFHAQNPLIRIGPRDILGTSDFAWELNNAFVDFANENGLKTSFSTLKNGYGVSMMLMQPIYAGGRIVNGNKLAAMGIEASQLQAELKIRETREDVESKYWTIVALQEKMKTLIKAESVMDSLNRYLGSAREAGLVAESDILDLKHKISELSYNHVKLKNGLKLAKMDLFNFIGFKYEYSDLDRITLAGKLEEIGNPENIAEEGDAMPVEFTLLEKKEMAKRLEKKISVGEFLPEVGAGVSYWYGDLRSRNYGQFNGAGVIFVKIPLTGIGKATERIRRMDYEIQKVVNEKEYLDGQLQLQRHQLFLDIETASDQAGLSKMYMDDAEIEMRRCELDYKAGRSTISDFLKAELQFRTASEKYIDDCIEYRKAVNSFKRRYCGQD